VIEHIAISEKEEIMAVGSYKPYIVLYDIQNIEEVKIMG